VRDFLKSIANDANDNKRNQVNLAQTNKRFTFERESSVVVQDPMIEPTGPELGHHQRHVGLQLSQLAKFCLGVPLEIGSLQRCSMHSKYD